MESVRKRYQTKIEEFLSRCIDACGLGALSEPETYESGGVVNILRKLCPEVGGEIRYARQYISLPRSECQVKDSPYEPLRSLCLPELKETSCIEEIFFSGPHEGSTKARITVTQGQPRIEVNSLYRARVCLNFNFKTDDVKRLLEGNNEWFQEDSGSGTIVLRHEILSPIIKRLSRKYRHPFYPCAVRPAIVDGVREYIAIFLRKFWVANAYCQEGPPAYRKGRISP
jgi:hypothetical protein